MNHWYSTLSSFKWYPDKRVLETNYTELKKEGIVFSGVGKYREIQDDLSIKSHVTGKEYIFEYRDYLNVRDFERWIYRPYDEQCPVKIVRIYDK
jgi:hypothetical protein